VPDTTIDGHRIEYRLTPPLEAPAPTVVFLHEGLGSLASWRDFPDRLAQRTGCGTLTYSRWGYGNSEMRPTPWPLSYLHDEARTDLPALLEHCGVTDAVLFGHSDGGSIALIAAAAAPGLARGLITEAAHVMVEDVTIDGLRAALARFDTDDFHAALVRQHGANADAVFGGWSTAWTSPAFRTWDIRPLLPEVTCPVLAIQGLDDDYGSEAQVDSIAALVSGPVESWLIAGCGHTPHRDKADDILDRAASFIARLRRRAA
jgi:pimeloyl-ACP methyl ester carboxylesterase